MESLLKYVISKDNIPQHPVETTFITIIKHNSIYYEGLLNEFMTMMIDGSYDINKVSVDIKTSLDCCPDYSFLDTNNELIGYDFQDIINNINWNKPIIKIIFHDRYPKKCDTISLWKWYEEQNYFMCWIGHNLYYINKENMPSNFVRDRFVIGTWTSK